MPSLDGIVHRLRERRDAAAGAREVITNMTQAVAAMVDLVEQIRAAGLDADEVYADAVEEEGDEGEGDEGDEGRDAGPSLAEMRGANARLRELGRPPRYDV
jgi:hypothetical protein